MSDEESTGTFGVALGANVVIAGAKLAAGLVTGPRAAVRSRPLHRRQPPVDPA